MVPEVPLILTKCKVGLATTSLKKWHSGSSAMVDKSLLGVICGPPKIGVKKWPENVDPIRSRVLQIGSRSDPDPAKLDLDPDLGAWIGDPVHHCMP